MITILNYFKKKDVMRLKSVLGTLSLFLTEPHLSWGRQSVLPFLV